MSAPVADIDNLSLSPVHYPKRVRGKLLHADRLTMRRCASFTVPLGSALNRHSDGQPSTKHQFNEYGETADRGRKADPDREGRTAWGLGGAAPASLDVYGQNRISNRNLPLFGFRVSYIDT